MMGLFTRDQHCYIMSVPSGYVKVGISDNVHRRLREIQAQCYEKVDFIVATHISKSAPFSGADLEQVMHIKLRPYAGERREWFKIDTDAAYDILITACWFLSTPPGHESFCSVHPSWVNDGDVDSKERAALFWGYPGAPGHIETCKRLGVEPWAPAWGAQ